MPLFLTPAELAELTGRTQRAAQCRWLNANGFDHRCNALGQVIVSRTHAEQVLGARADAVAEEEEIVLDFSAFQ